MISNIEFVETHTISYVVCVDRSGSNTLGSDPNDWWTAGSNTQNLVTLCEFLQAVPKSELYIQPWGGKKFQKLLRLRHIRDLMQARCVSINDAGRAGILNKFQVPSLGGKKVNPQKLFDKLQKDLAKNRGFLNDGDMMNFIEDKESNETIIQSCMPKNAVMDYCGASSFTQLFDGIEQASKLDGNVVCIIQTDGLLDALSDPMDRESERIVPTNDISGQNFNGRLGRGQFIEKLRAHFDNDHISNFSKLILQFAVHTDQNVIQEFSEAFNDVCLEIIGHSTATFSIINPRDKYIDVINLEVQTVGFKILPDYIMVAYQNRVMKIPRNGGNVAFLRDLFKTSHVSKIEFIANYLKSRIKSVETYDHRILEKQIMTGDVGILYSISSKLSNDYDFQKMKFIERGKEVPAELESKLSIVNSVTDQISVTMQKVLEDSGKKKLLQMLILSTKEDPEYFAELRVLVQNTLDDDPGMESIGYLGIGFESELPEKYDFVKAVSIDCKQTGLFMKHLRSYPEESGVGQELFIRNEKSVYPQVSSTTEYGLFLMNQFILIISQLTGDVVNSKQILFTIATILVTKRIGVTEHEIDPVLHSFLVELIKYFEVSNLLPNWKMETVLDDTEPQWIFEQSNIQMNPNFWKAILMSSRFQRNLNCQELSDHQEFMKESGHLVKNVNVNPNGTVDFLTNGLGLHTLSFSANRISSQLNLYRGLVRMKALQHLASKVFNSTCKLEVEIVKYVTVSKAMIETVKNNLISVVPTRSGPSFSPLGIWLPHCLYTGDGEFNSDGLVNSRGGSMPVLAAIYSRYYNALKHYQDGDFSRMETREDYVLRMPLVLAKIMGKSSGSRLGEPLLLTEKVKKDHSFTLHFQQILQKFGTSYFGINEKLIQRVLERNNLKLSRDDIREFSTFAVQELKPNCSDEEFLSYSFTVNTVIGTKKITLTPEHRDEIMSFYANQFEKFLNPKIDASKDIDVFTMCGCCMETTAVHLSGDSKAQRFDCGHQTCTTCAEQMVSVAVQSPLQLLACPYCRKEVSFEKLQRLDTREVILYDRLVLKGIRELYEDEGLVSIDIGKEMAKFYFGVCTTCKYDIVKMEKVCLNGLPKPEDFKCGNCIHVAQGNYLGPKKDSYDVKCPHCLIPVHRVDGCAFMTCLCGGNFCILCAAALTRDHHFSHFKKGSPFSRECEGSEGKNRKTNCGCVHCKARGMKKKNVV